MKQLELEIVDASLLRRKRHAFGVVALLCVFLFRFGDGERGARRARAFPCLGDRMLELRELALPGKHPVEIAVRREKADRLRRDEMAVRSDEGFPERETLAIAQSRADIAAATHAAQPIRE